MKVRDLIRLVELERWQLVPTAGSHCGYRHPDRPKVVTVLGDLNDDVPAGTLKSILRKVEPS